MARQAGSQITEAHIKAADALRLMVDIATIGLTGEQSDVRGAYGPSAGPSINAVIQAGASTQAAQVIQRLAPSQCRMAETIVLHNRSLQAWCHEEAAATGRRVNPEIEMGRLLALLDVLTDQFGLEDDRGGAREVVG
jgi:hypothetical protein